MRERYWTVLHVKNDSSKRSYYSGPADRRMAILGDEATTCDIKTIADCAVALNHPDKLYMLVMYGEYKWTDEDLKALRNAIVFVPYNARYGSVNNCRDELLVAFSPNAMRNPFVKIRRRQYNSYSSETAEHKEEEHFVLIRDGEIIKAPCESCDNYVRRGIGQCGFPEQNCTVDFFPEHAVMTVPDEKEFIESKLCTDQVPFEKRNIEKMLACNDNRLGIKVDSTGQQEAAQKGAITRMFRRIACTKCIFGEMVRDKNYARCGFEAFGKFDCWWHVESRNTIACGGPYFETDIPGEDIPEHAYKYHKLFGRYVSLDVFKDWHKKYGSDKRPAWRIDPELSIGYATENNFHIFQNRPASNTATCDFWEIPIDVVLEREEYSSSCVKGELRTDSINEVDYLTQLHLYLGYCCNFFTSKEPIRATRNCGIYAHSPVCFNGFGLNYNHDFCATYINKYDRVTYAADSYHHFVMSFPELIEELPAYHMSRSQEIAEALKEKKVKQCEKFVDELSAIAEKQQVDETLCSALISDHLQQNG